MHTLYFDLRDTKGQQKAIDDKIFSAAKILREGGLLDVLRAEPPLASKEGKTSPERFRIVADAEPSAPGAVPRQDLPLSFSPVHRQYGYRAVEELRQNAADRLETEHDPFSELY